MPITLVQSLPQCFRSTVCRVHDKCRHRQARAPRDVIGRVPTLPDPTGAGGNNNNNKAGSSTSADTDATNTPGGQQRGREATRLACRAAPPRSFRGPSPVGRDVFERLPVSLQVRPTGLARVGTDQLGLEDAADRWLDTDPGRIPGLTFHGVRVPGLRWCLRDGGAWTSGRLPDDKAGMAAARADGTPAASWSAALYSTPLDVAEVDRLLRDGHGRHRPRS